MKKVFLLLTLVYFIAGVSAQQFYQQTPAAMRWVETQFNKLSEDERIAQLMIIRAHSNLGKEHVQQVTELIKKYNIGGLCFFQGGPVRQATLTNYYQSITKTPLMIAIDGEWGLGMRLDSVINFPRQLMIGAITDAQLVYQFGRAVGEQCKRMGIHVNFAPDVDVNNNPLNPVINDRSFGEDKYKVALYGVQYMKGMQDVGVMACAKHFPGHGDVSVDSHKDLPVINKSRAALDDLELYPFKALINAGVGSIMIAHLSIPSIDTTPNLPTSLSAENVTGILRNELGYQGIAITDALEMQGVTKYFPQGDASVLSLIAGNDMLCLPGDIPESIQKIKSAIQEGKLTWEDINKRVKKILLAKYHLGLNKRKKVKINNILTQLNKQTNKIKKRIAEKAITVLRKSDNINWPLQSKKIAYLGMGIQQPNAFATKMQHEFNAAVLLFSSTDTKEKADSIIDVLSSYETIIVGLHNYSRRPANQFGLSKDVLYLITALQQRTNVVNLVFGNPYAIQYLCEAKNIIACYEDDDIIQQTAVDLLAGRIQPKGRLPVTVCASFKFGDGIVYNNYFRPVKPETVGMNSSALSKIDTLAQLAIDSGAAPGCVILVARNGKIVYHKAFGYSSSSRINPMTTDMVFDLASVTKISATTVAIMKLYEQRKIQLNAQIGNYLDWIKRSNKSKITIKQLLLHEAGLTPFISFYKELIDTTTGIPNPKYISNHYSGSFKYRVAENIYLKNNWRDSLYSRIRNSKTSSPGKYIYSDNDFIILGKIIEKQTGLSLDTYTKSVFFDPLQMSTTGFTPRNNLPLSMLVPTEKEKHFRQQQLMGDVHDEGASLFGGVSGHAGLFSNAYDLAQLYQMLLNGGKLNGIRFLQKNTISKFTTYNSAISRRGLGFDKPEKDNAVRDIPYPSLSVSPETYGHTGFTGTCVWVDPKYNLIYIFLSSRVDPNRSNNKLSSLRVRSNIQEAIYGAITK